MINRKYTEALEPLNCLITSCNEPINVIRLLYQRAYVHIELRNRNEAVKDLENLIILATQNYQEELKTILIEGLWMHFAVASTIKDVVSLDNDIKLLEQYDPYFPKAILSDEKVSVFSPSIWFDSVSCLRSLLKGCHFELTEKDVFIPFSSYEVIYKKSKLNPYHSQRIVQLAAACSFGNSPWAGASVEFVAPIIAPTTFWFPSLNFGSHCLYLLKNLDKRD